MARPYPKEFKLEAEDRYIEVFYNRKRRHSAPGYMTPVEFEMAEVA